MLTRCPHCETGFRVTPSQLKLRQGRVRCGACQSVFNALDSLADELPPAPPLPAAPADPLAEAGPAPAVEGAAGAGMPPPGAEAESRRWQDGISGDAASATAAGTAAIAEPAAPEAMEKPEMPETAEAVPAPGKLSVPQAAPVPAVWEVVGDVPPPRRWPWIGAMVLLLSLAAGQLTYQYRVELAVLAPELRPALAAGCAWLDCTLPRPRKSELIGIEASDLAPAGSDRLLLTATLKNRAPFDQEYPHLELTLTDTQDKALMRRVLAPAEYLPAPLAPADGFAPRADVAVRLTLEIPGVPAVGYRLYLFYP